MRGFSVLGEQREGTKTPRVQFGDGNVGFFIEKNTRRDK